jgi:hypothetical protein
MAVVSTLGNIFEDVAIKGAVRLASTAGNIALSGPQTIDGVLTNIGDRVLVTAQLDQTSNGIWQVQSGPWTRPTDASGNTDFIDGTLVPVARGFSNAGTMFQMLCTDSPVMIGTSLLVFEPQSLVAAGQSSSTSMSSQTVSIGAKTFAVAAGLGFKTSQYVLAYETGNIANVMLAQITGYSGTTLNVSVIAISGSGTHGDWTIVLTSAPGSIGLIPPLGTGNVTGAGSSGAGNFPVFADTTGKVLSDSGTAPGPLASRTALLYGDLGAASVGASALAPGAAPLPYCGAQPNDNLHLVNDGTNPTRDIDVTAGRCRDDSDITNLHLAAAMVKRLDTAWASGGLTGAPAGACDTGTKGASQTWHLFLIGKLGLAVTSFTRNSNVATVTVAAHGAGIGGTVRAYGIGNGADAIAAVTAVTTNTISYANVGANVGPIAVTAVADLFDMLASQSYSVPTLPSGWTAKQSIGSVLTDGSANIIAFFQYGNEFWLAAPAAIVVTAPASGALKSISVPLGVKVNAILNVMANTGNSVGQAVQIYLAPPDVTSTAGSGSAAPGMQVFAETQLNATAQDSAGQVSIWTNTLAQIRADVQGAGQGIIVSVGWRDPRRRLF